MGGEAVEKKGYFDRLLPRLDASARLLRAAGGPGEPSQLARAIRQQPRSGMRGCGAPSLGALPCRLTTNPFPREPPRLAMRGGDSPLTRQLLARPIPHPRRYAA